MSKRRLRLMVLGVAMAWDTGWKIAAITRAIRVRQYRWIAPLAVINSVGIVPMLYLKRWSRSGAGGVTTSTGQ